MKKYTYTKFGDNSRTKYSCYEYMNQEDSDLYDSVKDSSEEKDKIIKTLLETIAKASRNAHCNDIH